MTLSTLGAIGDTVVLVGLWGAVLAKRVPQAVRFPLALVAFASAWGLCFVIIRGQFPKWTFVPGMAAVVASMLLLVVAAQRSLPHDGGGGGGEDGGGGDPPPDRPTGGGSPDEPEWWPEFERDLVRYQAERERAHRGAPIRS